VLNTYFGKKVGQVLYQKALAVAKDLALKYLWLGVWEKNERAIQFYKKNGFIEFDQHIFKLGNDEQTDLLMRLFI
jgi:ribosomal protein S18 acetylase RimI-like enzyme